MLYLDAPNGLRLKVLILLALALTTPMYHIRAENGDSPIFHQFEKEIRFATLQDLYPSETHHDARMALEMIMQKTLVQLSYEYKVRLHFIDPSNNVADQLHRGNFDFVTLSGLDYCTFGHALGLKPILIPSKTDQPTEPLVLLSRKDQTLASIAEKEVRTLLIEYGRNGDLSKLWLDALLKNEGMQETEHLFSKIRRVKKPGRAVIPVFFNQADVCIVTENAFKTIDALNPQVSHQLKVLHRSDGLVRMVVCATGKPDREDIEDFVREATHIEHTPDTRQAMTIIQMKQFIQPRTEDLLATEKLVHNQAP